MHLREANVTDDASNTVNCASIVSDTSPITNRLDESSVVSTEMKVSQVSQKLVQSQGLGAVVRNRLMHQKR